MKYYDSIEFKLISESTEILETLTEMKRVLVACSKSKNITSKHIVHTAQSFNQLSEQVHKLNREELFLFYKKYNFFKSGVRVEFLN